MPLKVSKAVLKIWMEVLAYVSIQVSKTTGCCGSILGPHLGTNPGLERGDKVPIEAVTQGLKRGAKVPAQVLSPNLGANRGVSNE